ncbi:hypothetical protein A3Q56_01302 [Intoshia linei]|uniref:Sodium-dependent multivitamin transporter n=1 Tax=Intoshia linei TaxID=1819745 RepID=A0A177BB97_9BILA|nr:hypothetical protein A3Q56_01302 [Intoshia linei]
MFTGVNGFVINEYENVTKSEPFTEKYLEKRFNRFVSLFTTLMFIVQSMFYLALALYAPSLAVSTIEKINIWYIITATSLVTTIYTALGGMKLVLWSDAIQAVFMLVGPISIIIIICSKFGGPKFIFNEYMSYENKRKIINFNFDPTVSNTFWALAISSSFMWIGLYATNQCQVQRMISLRNVKKSKIALWMVIPFNTFCTVTLVMTGICINVYYSNESLNLKPDQILPYFINDVVSKYTSLSGIFYCSLLSASCSLKRGIENSFLCAIDRKINLLYLLISNTLFSEINFIKGSINVKSVNLILALIDIYVIKDNNDYTTCLALSLFGIFGCSILSIFILGMFIIPANSIGAIFGGLSGFVLLFSIVVLRYIGFQQKILKINFLHYGLINVVVSVSVGTLVSLITCRNKNKPFYPDNYFYRYRFQHANVHENTTGNEFVDLIKHLELIEVHKTLTKIDS